MVCLKVEITNIVSYFASYLKYGYQACHLISGGEWRCEPTHMSSVCFYPLGIVSLFLFFFLFFFFFLLFRAEPAAYGSSQARAQIGAVAAGLHHSHARSEPCLQPMLQLMAVLDP